MRELEFKEWLENQGLKSKVQHDCISRLKRIEREFDHSDIDELYEKDRCQFIMDAFANMGINDNMKQYQDATFPIGKYYMSTYRNAVKKYVTFRDTMAQ